MGTKNTPTDEQENQPGVVDVDNEDFGGSRLDDEDQDLDLGNEIIDEDDDAPAPAPKHKKGDGDESDEDDSDSDDGSDDSDKDTDESDDSDSAKKDGAEKDDNADSEDQELDEDDENSTRRVPVSRLNKEIDKRRRLEQELERLRQNSDQPERDVQKPQEGDRNRQSDDEETRQKQEDLDAELEKELSGAFEEMLDGDTGKATKAVMQAIQKNREESERLARQTSQNVYQEQSTQSRKEQELMDTANKIVSDFPELNSQNQDTFNPDVFDEVLELRDAYISSGMEPAQALQKSAGMVMRSYGVSPKEQQEQQEQQPETSGKKAPAKDPKSIEDKLKKRAAQPPRTEGDNDRGREKTAVTEMSEKDFDNLSEEELARLRGDIV